MNYNHKLFNTLTASIVVVATIATVVFATTVFAQRVQVPHNPYFNVWFDEVEAGYEAGTSGLTAEFFGLECRVSQKDVHVTVRVGETKTVDLSEYHYPESGSDCVVHEYKPNSINFHSKHFSTDLQGSILSITGILPLSGKGKITPDVVYSLPTALGLTIPSGVRILQKQGNQLRATVEIPYEGGTITRIPRSHADEPQLINVFVTVDKGVADESTVCTSSQTPIDPTNGIFDYINIGESIVIDLKDYFSFSEKCSDISYDFFMSDGVDDTTLPDNKRTRISAKIDGSVLTITGAVTGEQNIQVYASALRETSSGKFIDVTQDFSVVVTNTANACVISVTGSGSATVQEYEETTVTLTDLYTASDGCDFGKSPYVSVLTQDQDHARGSIDGDILTLTGEKAGSGPIIVTVGALDEPLVELIIDTTVTPAPLCTVTQKDIPDQDIAPNTSRTIDFTEYFTVSEGCKDGTFTITTTGNDRFTDSSLEERKIQGRNVVEGSELTITAVGGHSSGTEDYGVFYKTEGVHPGSEGISEETWTDRFLVFIRSTPVCTISKTIDIPDQTVVIGTQGTLDVSSYFSAQNCSTPITYGHTQGDTDEVTVAGLGVNDATLTMDGSTAGTEDITITATSGNVSVQDIFTITVEAPAPVCTITKGTTPAQTLEVGRTITLDVADFFTIADCGEITYRGNTNNNHFVLSGLGQNDSTLSIRGKSAGSTSVTITARQGNTHAATTLAVTVTPPAATCSITTRRIPDQTVDAESSKTLDVASYFQQKNCQGVLTYSGSVNSDVANVGGLGFGDSTMLITGRSRGMEKVTVTVSSGTAQVTDSFTITVHGEDPLPPTAREACEVTEILPIPAQRVQLGEELILDITDYFTASAGCMSLSYAGGVITEVTGSNFPITTSENIFSIVYTEERGHSLGVHTVFVTLTGDDDGNIEWAVPVTVLEAVTPSTDTIDPVISAVSSIATGTDTTPDLTFTASEVGALVANRECGVTTQAVSSGTNTITLSSLAPGTYSACTIQMTDDAGNTSVAVAIPAFTINAPPSDTTAPSISNVGSIGVTKDLTPDLTFTTSEAGTLVANLSCGIPAEVVTEGTNTITLIALAPNTYSACTIQMTDEAGNTSAATAIPTFVIDRTLPVISNVSSIATGTDATPNLTFTASEAGVLVANSACGITTETVTKGINAITLAKLAPATYSTCTIQMTDEAGNTGTATAIPPFTISVDVVAPVISVVSSIGTTTDTTPNLSFNASKAGTLIANSVCGIPAVAVTQGTNVVTLTVLAPNTYSICTIRMTDKAGNLSDHVPIPTFTISGTTDTTPPVISGVSTIGTTTDTTPDLTFTASEAGILLVNSACGIVTEAITQGRNTITLSSLTPGTYSTCTLQMADAVNNRSAEVSIPSFTISRVLDTTPPVISAVSSIVRGIDTTPDLTFTASEAGTLVANSACGIEATAVTAGLNTITLTTLSLGTYSSCAIQMTDEAGNTGAAVAIPSFTIITNRDTTIPVISSIVAIGATATTTPDLTFTVSEDGTLVANSACGIGEEDVTLGENTITLSALAEGTYRSCTIQMIDASNNRSVTLFIPTFTIDTTVPVISGVSAIGTTTDTTPDLSFYASEAGTLVANSACGIPAVAVTQGTQTITLTARTAATYGSCTIQMTDAAGNSSTAVSIASFTIQNEGGRIDLKANSDSGSSNTDDITNSQRPTFTVSGLSTSAQVTVTARQTGETDVTGTRIGNGDITLTTTLAEGEWTVSATDGTITTPTLTITIDITRPDTITNVSEIGTTGDTTPDLTFTTSEAGVLVASPTCGIPAVPVTQGVNTVTLTVLTPNTYGTCTIQMIDKVGYTSPLTNIPSFVVQIGPAVDLTSASDTGSSNTDNITNDTTPTFTVSGLAISATVTVTATQTGQTTVTHTRVGNGDVTLPTLAEGVWSVVASDGTTTTPSISVTVDTTAPTAITSITAIPTGTDTTPNLAFTTPEAGVLVENDDCGITAQTVTAGPNTITLAELGTETHSGCTIQMTDVAGNTSPTATIPSFTIEALTVTVDLKASSDTGTSNTDKITNDNTPTFTVSGFASDASITLFLASGGATVPARGTGNADITVLQALADGVWTITGGDGTNTVPPITITIDTTAPTVITGVGSIGSVADATPDLTFTAPEAGVLVANSACGITAQTVTAGAQTITLTTLAPGTYGSCTIQMTDVAGNASPAATIPSFTLTAPDTTNPVISAVSSIGTTTDTTPALTFTASEAGTLVVQPSCGMSGTTAVTSGTQTINLLALTPGPHASCTIQMVDAAGNKSAVVAVPSFTITPPSDANEALQAQITALGVVIQLLQEQLAGHLSGNN